VIFGLGMDHMHTYKLCSKYPKSTIKNMATVRIIMLRATTLAESSKNIAFKVVSQLNIIKVFMKSICNSEEHSE
jgi:hypothetical protein